MKLLLTLFLLLPSVLFAIPKDSTELITRKVYTTEMITQNFGLELDGKIEEKAWNLVEWAGDFTVNSPNNGEKPQRQTKFKILYDDQFMYIGYRCYDEDPTKIEERLARRDHFPGDWIEINIDSYHDLRTAFAFTVSASGVKGDEFITSDGNNWDSNWNPIWYLATNIDAEGWTAEIKIPFSQLRFGNEENQVWGFNIMRRDFRADERSTWQHIPQNSSGWVSKYAELHGINSIKPKRQVEIQPYVLTRIEKFEKEEGNPYRDGSELGTNIGLDGKVGITNDLTLDFTINPDFGQVEADPSRLTLDGFQLFFSERRPFFIENANLFGFQVSSAEAGGNFNRDNLFYSRRIGQAPRGSVLSPDDAFTDTPDFTSILGAAKLSGKTKNGLSIGILESITSEEKTKVFEDGSEYKLISEPLSNYFVGKISQDYNKGATVLGATLTSVTRRLEGTGLEDQFHSDATTGGLSIFHSWKNREWQFNGNFIFSNVQGTEARITETQESFEHYYQRPDAEHLSVDESRTHLAGHGGTVTIGNYWGKDNLSFQTGGTWRSPGVELNDIGFLNTADEINHFFWGGWRAPKPFGKVRRLQVNYNHYLRWTYGGEHLYSGINTNAFVNFRNTWGLGGGTTIELKDISQKALFGGPLLRRNKGLSNWVWISSDNRKKIQLRLNLQRFTAVGQDKGALDLYNINTNVSMQPTDALSISFSPSYFAQDRAIQNVEFRKYEDQDRYITGRVDQRTFSFSTRINYSVTPNFTIEYWGQPFISRGNYTEFKYITDALATDYEDRFHLYKTSQISQLESDDTFYIDENEDQIVDYSFDNPDFNFLQFRSNLVLRWEYTPGSELFLVWTQSTSSDSDPNKGIFPSLTEDLFSEKINNIFLMKFTYRFLNK